MRQKVGDKRQKDITIYLHFLPCPNPSFSNTCLFFHPSLKRFLSASPALNYELLGALNMRYLSPYKAARCRYKDALPPFKIHYNGKNTQPFTVAIHYRSILTLTS